MNILARLPKAPLPEHLELAYSLRGKPKERLGAIMYLVEFVMLALGVVLSPRVEPHLVIVCWLLAAIADQVGTITDSKATRALNLAGFGPALRVAVRALVAALALASAPLFAVSRSGATLDARVPLTPYIVLVILTEIIMLAQNLLVNVVSNSTPPLAYHPSAAQERAYKERASFYASTLNEPVALLVGECAAVMLGFLYPTLAYAALVIPLGYFIYFVLRTAGLLMAAKPDAERLLQTLGEAKPGYLIYVSFGQGQSNYIANQWLPVLDKVPDGGFVMVREASQLRPLISTKLPIVYAPSQRHVEALTFPSVKVALYPAFGDKNAHLMRNINVDHVMIIHGDSDKSSSYNATARGFDHVFVAGEAAVDRYWRAGVEIPRERFRIVGRPQTESLTVGPLNHDRPTILYAPTFEGYTEQNNYTSLASMGEGIVAALLAKDIDVVFKPHPSTGVLKASMLGARSKIVSMLDGHGKSILAPTAINDCFQEADVLIADVSAVVSDFLYTERPIIACDVAGLGEEKFRETYPSLASAYVLAPDLSNLDEVLGLALGVDPLGEARAEAKLYLLGDTPNGPQAAFNAAMAELIGR
ncbi:MAG: CDP-glycerol glycerophosphotransferase family protein [Propionibacteriaceae bacterium]|nr:CDP-glycerol glycerophosphotransferase family protein [Propionibacteriaceae bacterium]